MKNITPFKVIDYAQGMVITDTCIVRNVPMAAYHSQTICAAPSISSSGLRTIESETLSHFYDKSDLNPDKAEEEPKHHFAWGKALHHLAGGEADFAKHFAMRPAQWDSWRTKDAKAWRAVQQLEGRDVLTPDDMVALRIAASRLAHHPTIQAGILTGLIEHSIFVKRHIRILDGRVVTIFLKARPDVIPVDSSMIVDLKSTADAGPVSVRRSIGEFAYHQQLALAGDCIFRASGRKMTDNVLVFIESSRPCEINIKPLEPEAIEYGHRQNWRAMQKFATAIATSNWTGYDDDEVPAGLPPWLSGRLAREAEDGLLPIVPDESDPQEEVALEEEAI